MNGSGGFPSGNRASVVAAAFRARTGRAPAGVWAAPGRVNLIGEHTDYNDGFVLPLALHRRAVVAAAPAAGGSRVWSAQRGDGPVAFTAADVAPGAVGGWAAYAAGVVWALREAGVAVPEVDLVIDSDVPIGAGLSSSAAFECAVGAAVAALAGVAPEPTMLAQAARRAENGFVGVPTGIMDQMAAVHGRAGHLLLLDTRSLAVEQVPLDLPGRGLALLVIDTRAPRSLVDGRYAQRRAACAAAARALGVPALRDVTDVVALAALPAGLLAAARHVVTENARVARVADLLRAGADPRRAGPALTASHASLRDDLAVSVPQLDVAVEAALSAGAHGARMTGGGFGGCVIALVDRGATAAVTAAVEAAFARAGFGPPAVFETVPSAGASRLV